MLALGTKAPDFNLPDVVSDKNMTWQDIATEKATVVMFICNHCPFVIHIQDEIVRLAKDYQPKNVSFVAISANDVNNYPADSPDKMKELALLLGFTFPYLYDETQAVAKAFDAACTPDFYVFDEKDILVYRGRLDGATPGNDIPLTGEDIRQALDCLLLNEAVTTNQLPSMGCNIKWK